MINLSKKAKIIIGAIVGVLVVAGVIGGSIAIANAVRRTNRQSVNMCMMKVKLRLKQHVKIPV